ncbi:MAG: helix-turn-helix transcriptional regulator [Chitinophagaceae bacterium]|nr:helix-turn-helix transcriptional regulator [Chitinophagaceae bacterium]
MTNSKQAKKHSSAVLSQLLQEITPLEREQINNKMSLAARLDDLIKAKGWSKSEFAEKVNKNPSEISKWLSGTQNFTVDTLVEIAAALETSVAELFAPKQIQVVNRVHIVTTRSEAPQSIKIDTPVSKSIGSWSVLFSGSLCESLIPLTSQMKA